jgi:F-type H+-transporting ATPase subunit alpha
VSNILQELETQISALKTNTTRSNIGVVREIGDGVAKIEGLSDVMLNEMIDFGNGLFALALNLEECSVVSLIRSAILSMVKARSRRRPLTQWKKSLPASSNAKA